MLKPAIAIIFLVLLAPIAAFTQSIANLRKYTILDGLAGNQVTSLIQDPRGLLWVGTTKGLNWYDGNRFYQPPIRPRSGELFVSNIIQDSEKNIWLTTYYNGIYKYANGRFENFLPDTVLLESINNNVNCLLEYRPGDFLVATALHLYTFRHEHFVIFDTALDNKKITIDKMMMPDSTNLLVIPEYTKGIWWYSFHPDGSFRSRQIFQEEVIHDLHVDGGDIRVSGEGGSARFHSLQELSAAGDSGSPFNRAGKMGGLPQKPGEAIYKDPARKPIKNVNAVLTDSMQNTWIATHDGLIKLTRRNYTLTGLRQPDIPSSTIISTQEDATGSRWYGTFNGLLCQEDHHWRYFNNVAGQPIGFVHSLRKDPAGFVWAGANTGLLQLKKGHAEWIARGVIITSLSEDSSHSMWAGDTSGNIYQLRNKQLLPSPTSPHVKDLVTSIIKDEYGYLWVGYFTYGLVKYEWKAGHWQALQEFTTKTGFENGRIRCLCIDGHGNLLAGTRTRGYFLFSLRQRTYANVRNITKESNGLSDNWIKRILVDKQGQLLLATGYGVDVLSGDPSNPVVTKTSFSDGENFLEPYSLDLVDTTFLIGSTDALISFDPTGGSNFHAPLKVFFTRVTINGYTDSLFVPYTPDPGTRNLSSHQNNLSFDFCSVNFDGENNTHYKYMLEGIDTAWSSPISGTYLNYSSLPSGRYTLKVIAQNRAGIWGGVPATISFIIATPFWRQGWFITLVALTLLGIIYMAYRSRIQHLLAIERIRTRIATDLHDDIGSTLSSIGILSNIALKEGNNTDQTAMVEEIRRSSSVLMEKMDDIVWSINPKKDKLEDLMARIRRIASKLFEAKDISYKFHIEESAKHVKLPMITRQHIYLILKEAVNNLVKYANCSEACVEIWIDEGCLHARVSDNGIGFDNSIPREGNGLLNMRSRAAGMHANIRIESAPGKGSTISLSVKIK